MLQSLFFFIADYVAYTKVFVTFVLTRGLKIVFKKSLGSSLLHSRPFWNLSSAQEEDEGEEKKEGIEGHCDQDRGRVVLRYDVLGVNVLKTFFSQSPITWHN